MSYYEHDYQSFVSRFLYNVCVPSYDSFFIEGDSTRIYNMASEPDINQVLRSQKYDLDNNIR